MASTISLPPIIFPNTEIPSFEEILEDEDVNNLVFPNDDMDYLFRMEDLSEGSVIGSSMHVVKRYLHIPSGNFMAVKQIHIPLSRHLDETKEKRLRKLNLEIHTHREIANSPYIVDFYGLCLYDGCALLCMELMDMSLHGLFTRCHYLGKIIPEDLLGYTAVSILEALNVCKSKGIIHRDIKPENILIKKSGEIKLADFGESRFVDDSQKATTLGAGTIRYWPPERLYMERTKYDIRSDIWSFGLTLVEMAYGKYPIVHADGSDIDFQTVDLLMLQHQILEATADDIVDRCIRSKYSEDLCEFIWLCLQKLEDRANVEELVETDLYERFQARNTKWVAKLIQQALGEKKEQQENKKRIHRMPRKPDPKEIDLIWHQIDAEQETNILCLGPPNIGKTSAIKYFIHNLTRIANLDQEVLNFPDIINPIPVIYTCSKENIKYRFIDMPGIAEDNVNSFIEDKISTKKPQEKTPLNHYGAAYLSNSTLVTSMMTSEKHLFSSLLHMLPTSMKIHRVCIFLKASIQVTTPYVLYCFMKILMNLHVASIEKISFCFINDEEISKNVSTGLSSLKLFCGDLSRLYGINLSCSDSNVFNILNSDLEMVEKVPEHLNIPSKEAIRFLNSAKSTSSFRIKHIQILNTARNIVILMGQMLAKSLNEAIESTKFALDQSKRFLDNHKRYTKIVPPSINNHASSSLLNMHEQQYERDNAFLEFYYTKEKNLKRMHKKFCDLLVNNAILPYISLLNLRDLNLQLRRYKKEQTYDPSEVLHLEQLLDQTKLYNMEPPETNDCITDEDELELAFKKLLDEPHVAIFFSSGFSFYNDHDKHVVLSTYYGYLKEFVEILKNCREIEFNLG